MDSQPARCTVHKASMLMEAGRTPPPPHPSLPPQKARAAFTPIPPTDLPAPHPG